ncbi:MAG: hypothetical protein KGM98_00255 [Bacteroidota bacterium]|nr:hypothetical protein [Bacteroidota bacterium]
MRKLNLLPILLLVVIPFVGCQAQKGGGPTKEIVEKTIQDVLYPASNNSEVSVTTLQFHRVLIAKGRKLGVGELYGFPAGTVIYHVLASFTSTDKVQESPDAQPMFTAHDITQEYYFYKDDFGKWALDIISGSENKDVERQWTGN